MVELAILKHRLMREQVAVIMNNRMSMGKWEDFKNARIAEENLTLRCYKNMLKFAGKFLLKSARHLISQNTERQLMPVEKD
jgi:hypothetical protein